MTAEKRRLISGPQPAVKGVESRGALGGLRVVDVPVASGLPRQPLPTSTGEHPLHGNREPAR